MRFELSSRSWMPRVRRGAPVQCEMGGQNPAIVLPDADLAVAAEQIAVAAFGFAGQKCTATKRIIVVGDPTRPDAVPGRVRRDRRAARNRRSVRREHCGGTRDRRAGAAAGAGRGAGGS